MVLLLSYFLMKWGLKHFSLVRNEVVLLFEPRHCDHDFDDRLRCLDVIMIV